MCNISLNGVLLPLVGEIVPSVALASRGVWSLRAVNCIQESRASVDKIIGEPAGEAGV